MEKGHYSCPDLYPSSYPRTPTPPPLPVPPVPAAGRRARGQVYSHTDSWEIWSLRPGVKLGHAGRQGAAGPPAWELRSPSCAFWEWEKMIQEFPPHSPRRPGRICRGNHRVIMALSAVPCSSFRHRANSFQTSVSSTGAYRTVVFKEEAAPALKISSLKSIPTSLLLSAI